MFTDRTVSAQAAAPAVNPNPVLELAAAARTVTRHARDTTDQTPLLYVLGLPATTHPLPETGEPATMTSTGNLSAHQSIALSMHADGASEQAIRETTGLTETELSDLIADKVLELPRADPSATPVIDVPFTAIRLISFGYLHLPTGPDGCPVPPAADRVEDVRDRLRDPAAARDILDLDGLNPRVQDIVLATPGARELLANLTGYAALPAGPRRIAIGCAGGKHRASGLTELLARELRARGRQVDVEHLHVHLPRVLKQSDPGTRASA
ncbi:RapZ C-terminal domain-containing protein [Streptomyces sp. CB02009]|uniref:RapZ C-terminal domain-containing protein n=1 Tax=Streptomyces sp. CB02009 TaxID=1703938 RepID=UPI000A5706FA|nr:RNase adapter RapZ [Streptomyces sp. CB02009]